MVQSKTNKVTTLCQHLQLFFNMLIIVGIF